MPNEPKVIHEAAVFIRTVSWSFGFIGVQFALMGVLRASGQHVRGDGDQPGVAMGADVSAGLRPVAPAPIWAAHGIWWAFPVANGHHRGGEFPVVLPRATGRSGASSTGLTDAEVEAEIEAEEINEQVMV